MLAGQKMKGNDNKEVMLFPFETLYMTQDEGGDYSHQGTYNIDFLGMSASSTRIFKCPFYAPCTLKCVDIWDSTSNNRVYESVDKVHLADGTIDYVTITFAHDDNPIHNVGDVINQGEILGHTGTTGEVTGDHTHSCCGKGKYVGYTKRETGRYDLTNRIHYWDCTYVNDTIILRGFNHTWKNYTGGITPTGASRKNRFNWGCFTRKIRKNKNF